MNPTFPNYFNMVDYFLDDRIKEGRGDHVAVIDDCGRYSYRDIAKLSGQVASALAARGIGPEDRVLLALFDSVEFVATFFGVIRLGAVVTMVNPELPDPDYDYYLDYTRARALVIEAPLADRIAPAIRNAKLLRAVIRCRGGTIDTWENSVLNETPLEQNYPTSKDDPAVWLFTSGSTGKPLGAIHLHHDFPYNTECYAKQILGTRADDVTLSVPKLFFGYATGNNLLFPFAVGATAVLFADRATPERIGELCARHRGTVLTCVPTMINKMVQHAETNPDSIAQLASLRVCTSAGEALPVELYQRFKSKYGVEILDGIGSAELFHVYISNRLDDVVPGSLGRVVPGYEARIVRSDGSEADSGEIGTLWVKGDSAAIGYFQAHEKSKSVLRGDWVVSSDLFRKEENGHYYYAGRADDMLKVGGIFVSPLEVESCLLIDPRVLEAAVVGYDEGDGLTKPLAFVVLKSGAGTAKLAEEMIAQVRQKLAHYKAPRRIEFVAELPRSDRGKILRRELRKASK